MSSCSDPEDFYDAAEETPSTSFASVSPSRIAEASLSELEEEERRLMQLKRRAEERRRHEDDELEQRLHELQQRKRASGSIRNIDSQDVEQEERRRKLEEMRSNLGTAGSFSLSGSIDSSSQDTDSPVTAGGDVSDAFTLSALRPTSSIIAAPKSHTIEKMENNGVQSQAYRHHAKKRSGSWGDLPKNDSQLQTASASANTHIKTSDSSYQTSISVSVQRAHSTSSESSWKKNSLGRHSSRGSLSREMARTSISRVDSLKSGRPGKGSSDDVCCGGITAASLIAGSDDRLSPLYASREDKMSDLDHNLDWYPEKDTQNKSLTLLMSGRRTLDSDSVVDTILQQTQVDNDNDTVGADGNAGVEEPDIVKSTKTRTPPSTLKPPVAPPRRKKSRHPGQDGTPPVSPTKSGSEPSTHLLLRGEPPSPNLGANRNRENSLDVKTLLEGNRHIVVDESSDIQCKSLKEPNIPSSGLSDRGAASASSNSPRADNVTTSSSSSSSRPSSHHKADSTTAASSGAATDSHSMLDSLTIQIQNWQKLAQSERDASPNRRPRSSSGRLLSDEEILELVTVRNLDTGETIPLSSAEDKLPKCVNPLALHIMRRTKEYSSDTSLHIDELSDESDSRSEKSVASSSNNVRKKRAKLKKLIGKTVNRVKSAADSALHSDPPVEEEVSVDGKIFKIKASSKNKGPYDFSQPNLLQDLSGEHSGAIWVMKFSPCGKLLATGGQDTVLRIWVLKSTSSYFEDFRQKYADMRLSPAVSHESLNSTSSADTSATKDPLRELHDQTAEEELMAPFQQRPFCVYKGHTADLLDLSWSKNYFILSSSMDKTVRLWHISRRECLCTFQHIDFVTAIVFHPKDDRYFLSGALDGKLRLWNIPDKKVTLWNELSGSSNLITTANFCYNGRLAVVGTYDGKCIFYTTEQLKYYTMVNVRSTRGKNSRGRKITGIETMPGEEKILVTSNDSRLRMYNLKDLTLSCKYKGCMNNSSQIRASFSPTGKYVVCGSEDHFLYVWKTNHEFLKFTSARRDRNDYWEAIKVHNAVVTSAVFAPNPSFIFRMAEQQSLEARGSSHPLSLDDDTEEREIIVSADFTGTIKVITNRPNSRSMFF